MQPLLETSIVDHEGFNVHLGGLERFLQPTDYKLTTLSEDRTSDPLYVCSLCAGEERLGRHLTQYQLVVVQL